MVGGERVLQSTQAKEKGRGRKMTWPRSQCRAGGKVGTALRPADFGSSTVHFSPTVGDTVETLFLLPSIAIQGGLQVKLLLFA